MIKGNGIYFLIENNFYIFEVTEYNEESCITKCFVSNIRHFLDTNKEDKQLICHKDDSFFKYSANAEEFKYHLFNFIFTNDRLMYGDFE